MTPTVYLNGKFVAESEAAVNVYDGAFLHGAGLFETLRAQGGRVFRLPSHLERLRRSAGQLLSPLEPGGLPSEDVFLELLERNGLSAARVRVTLSAGSVRETEAENRAAWTLCVTASPLVAYSEELYERGVQAAVCDHRVSTTDPIAAHKTTAHLPRLLGLRFAQQKRCMEALWFNTRNQLAEGSISNVFVVHKGVLRTPSLDTPVLPGITRGIVLELAEKAGIACDQTPLGVDELLDADEVFLTNAVMQVMPVIRVERHDIGDGKVGPMTKRISEDYRAVVSEECEKR